VHRSGRDVLAGAVKRHNMNFSENEEESREVIVTDIRMPFWSMVWFMVKLSIAAIPAGIILAVIYFLFASVVVTLIHRMQ
jgi:hypothetical protein